MTASKPHQQLEDAFMKLRIFPLAGINLLNELGIISDHVVTLADIADSDAEFAVTIMQTFVTNEIPTYTQEQLDEARAISDALLEAIEINQAMGIESAPLMQSDYSRALRRTRFLERRLAEQAS